MPSRERQRRAKRREEYIQNRNGELETSRVRYNASKRGRVCCDEQNSDDIRASKKQKYQETKLSGFQKECTLEKPFRCAFSEKGAIPEA